MPQDSHPPHALPEIQLLVSQYLDGELDAETRQQLEALMAQYPVYKEELRKLQSLQSSIRSAQPDNGQSGDLWQNLARQLEADQHVPLMNADPEFICAYFDGEVSTNDPHIIQFERQLPRNAEANRLLGNFASVSDAIRQYACRLEESCTLDISASVMAALQAEREGTADPVIEMLSAFADQELSAKETIEANKYIESHPETRDILAGFTRLSEVIQGYSTRLQEQAPDLWPAVKTELEQVVPITSAGSNKVVPFKKALRIAVPVSVAALFLMAVLPQWNSADRASTLAYEPNQKQTVARAMLADQEAEAAEMAMAAPVSPTMQRNASYASAGSGASDSSGPMLEWPQAPQEAKKQELDARADMPHPSVAPLAPMLEPAQPSPPARQKAAARSAAPNPAVPRDEQQPSSEEYLFQSLSQQMSEEEILALLGN